MFVYGCEGDPIHCSAAGMFSQTKCKLFTLVRHHPNLPCFYGIKLNVNVDYKNVVYMVTLLTKWYRMPGRTSGTGYLVGLVVQDAW